jgi:hypothetical protein
LTFRTRAVAGALALLWAASASAQEPSPEQIQQIISEIEEITGMKARRPVPFEVIEREKWKDWVAEQIAEHVKPEEIRVEELALKKFGLLPAEFDLKQATIDLLGEQAAAVYDHRKKRMMLVQGGPIDGMGQIVLVHELAHAIADQNVDLKKFLEKGPKTDESALARMAVVEGQATWVMMESQMKRMGTSLKGNSEALKMMLPATGQMAAGAFPVFDKAPLYMKESLLFPYTMGLVFQQQAVEKYGKEAFLKVLREPPATAQQVMHPEKYFAGKAPVKVEMPAFPLGKEYARTLDGTIGELDFQVLFRQYGDAEEAKSAAEKWTGGSFDLWESRRDKRAVLRWSAEWESEAGAREAVRLYRKVQAGKWKRTSVAEEGEWGVKGVGDDGGYAVVREGTKVTVVEGMPSK